MVILIQNLVFKFISEINQRSSALRLNASSMTHGNFILGNGISVVVMGKENKAPLSLNFDPIVSYSFLSVGESIHFKGQMEVPGTTFTVVPLAGTLVNAIGNSIYCLCPEAKYCN